jgi:hypothetical protein
MNEGDLKLLMCFTSVRYAGGETTAHRREHQANPRESDERFLDVTTRQTDGYHNGTTLSHSTASPARARV